MSFSVLDFLISLPITAVIIFAIKIMYKRAKTSPTPAGCLMGCLIMYWLVLCSVAGCSKRRQAKAESHLTKVTLVSTGEIIKVPKVEFVGMDTVYRDSKHVYKNDTGRDLVEYMVKYTKNGYNSNDIIYGHIISPGEYFYWLEDDKDYRMFTKPPGSTTIVTHGNYKLDFTYLTFLDYIDNVPDYVIVEPYLKAK